MKKTTKRLKLNQESVRTLTTDALHRVAAGELGSAGTVCTNCPTWFPYSVCQCP